MRNASHVLMDSIADSLQVGAKAPSLAVYVKQRYWDDRDIYSGGGLIADNQKWYQLSNRVLSVEVQEDTEQFASSFTVTFSNEEGQLSPDNYTGKWPDGNFMNPEDREMIYARQLYQNNEMLIYLGYGQDLLPFIHGWTGDVKMTAEGANIVVQCMTSYKHIIHQTIKEDVIIAPEGNLFNVLKFFFDHAGVVLKGSKVYVPGSNEEWIIKGAKGTRGQSYDEVIRELIDTTFHYIRANTDGSCTLEPIPEFNRTMDADVIFDEGINLTSLEYTITDQDIYNAVTVKSGNFKNSFNNGFLYEDVLLRRWREEILDVPWANTYFKRHRVAIASHVKSLHRWRVLNAGVVGDPRLQLWDKVGIREHTTSQTWNWHIKGIQTMIDADSGFFQILQLSVNYGFDSSASYSDISPIQVSVPTIRLKVWDWSAEDGDIINIYCNNKVIKLNYLLLNNPTFVDINLLLGNNTVVFEGVSAGKLQSLSGRLQVLDTNNNILFDVGSIPDLNFSRTNVNKNGFYKKKPSKSWTVARVN